MVRMCHMTHGWAVGILGLAIFLGSGQALTIGRDDAKTAFDCYSNFNGFMRMSCNQDQEIYVLQVIYGVKALSSQCKSPATFKSYDEECCHFVEGDCTFKAANQVVSSSCHGHPNCEVRVTWHDTSEHCDQQKYQRNSNYMVTTYTCRPSTSIFTVNTTRLTKASNSQTTVPPLNTTSPLSLSSESASTSNSGAPVRVDKGAQTLAPPTRSSGYTGPRTGHHHMSTSMIGAIVGGSIGMLLTFIVFIFYWGRKRRLRIISKPEPNVWDYLLSQTFTVRGSRGYDHFSSTRSSQSSEGEAVSPVARKNQWLPNISPREDNRSDVINNFDTVSEHSHRIEIHQSANPRPYAFLKLGVPQNQLSPTNNEA